MAGKTLDFEVEVVSVRDVTPEDLAAKGGCGCGCHDCDGGCDGESTSAMESTSATASMTTAATAVAESNRQTICFERQRRRLLSLFPYR